MSLINQVLKDLHARRGEVRDVDGLRPAPVPEAVRSRAGRRWLTIAGIIALAGLLGALAPVLISWYADDLRSLAGRFVSDPPAPVAEPPVVAGGANGDESPVADTPVQAVADETEPVDPVVVGAGAGEDVAADTEPPARVTLDEVAVERGTGGVHVELRYGGDVALHRVRDTVSGSLVLDLIGADPSVIRPFEVPPGQTLLRSGRFTTSPGGDQRLELSLGQGVVAHVTESDGVVSVDLAPPVAPKPVRDAPRENVARTEPQAEPQTEPRTKPAERVSGGGTMQRTLVVESPRRRADSSFAAGVRALSEGRTADAERLFRDALGHDATLHSARLALANLLAGSGRSREAEVQLQAGLKITPGEPGLAERYARLLLERGDLAGAIGVLSDHPPSVPNQPEYHALRAALLQQAGNHEEAADAYASLVDVRPDNGIWWVGLAISLEARDRGQAALDAYRRAVRDPRLSGDVANFVNTRISALQGAVGEPGG